MNCGHPPGDAKGPRSRCKMLGFKLATSVFTQELVQVNQGYCADGTAERTANPVCFLLLTIRGR